MKMLLLITFCTLSGFAFGTEYTVNTIPNPKTANAHAYVTNPDGILSAETVQLLNVKLDSLEAQTGAEMAVVVVNSIGMEEIKPFATNLFSEWKIGKAKQDNGLLLLFVLDQRRVTFETGYGLEGTLPDAICKRIQMQEMIPQFKKGNYDAGIVAGVERTIAVIKNEPVATAPAASSINWGEVIPLAIGAYLLLVVLSFAWLSNSIRKIQSNARFTTNIARYKAAKSQKAGINSLFAVFVPIAGFVLILFFSKAIYLLLLLPVPLTVIPADIYGRIAMRRLRRAPIPCNVCGGKMHILSEKEEDEYLKLGQQFEEQLHATDYDVFLCDSCKNEAIFTLDKPSAYSECPRCKTKAFILKEKRTMVAPTYFSAGTERATYHCKFCGYEEHHNNNLPRLTRDGAAFAGGAMAGSLFSGRGGFGGGGGGFSGGSFGGGMSGGGGATSDW